MVANVLLFVSFMYILLFMARIAQELALQEYNKLSYIIGAHHILYGHVGIQNKNTRTCIAWQGNTAFQVSSVFTETIQMLCG